MNTKSSGRRSRLSHSPAFKAKVALAALREDKTMAKMLQISRGAGYYRSRPTSEADLALMRRIDEPHLEHPFMGASGNVYIAG
jgi:hypothetical protein